MAFQTSPGMAKGTSSFQKRCQGESRSMAAASCSSLGSVRKEA
ncbi:Uncharacterised protein [Klebsiella pneumoniae]|nr:Uncharacterised protein [Klebsiella pneumoniae]